MEKFGNKNNKFKNFFIKIIGYFIVIASFVFIFFSLKKIDLDLIKEQMNFSWVIIIIALSIAYSSVILLNSFAWKKLIELFHCEKINLAFISSIYLKANIAKYLPGNVFHFAGRHYLVKKKGVSNKALLLGNGMEIFFLIATSFLIVLLGLFNNLIYIPEVVKERINVLYFFILGIIILGAISIFFIYKKKQNKLIDWQSLFYKKNIFVYAFVMFLYFLIFIIIGILLYSIFVLLLDYDFLFKNMLFSIASFSLAWVLGYVVPGAPGGLGIRESIIVIMFTPVFNSSNALIAAFLLRVITILGDIFGFLLGNLISVKKA